MPERGQLPVDHGGHPRIVGVEDHVVDAVVPVHERGLVPGRDVGGQPRQELLHRLDVLGL